MTQPIYKRIVEALKKEINNLKPNTPILSERELSIKFDASRMTVRKAIGILEEEGFLYRDGNVGTFVADQNLRKTLKNHNINQIFNAVKNYRIIYFDVKSNNIAVAEKLDIGLEDLYVRIVRLNMEEGKIASLDEIYIVKKFIEADTSDIKSILSYSGNINSGSMKQEYSAVLVPIIYANLMKLNPNTPIVKVDSTIHTKNGKVYAHVISYKHPQNSPIQMVV